MSDPRPIVLDLFCNAGGAATGYARAGFRVIGVDIEPQPNYPFEFIEMDVFAFLITFREFVRKTVVLIHASPPCQAKCTLNKGTNRVREFDHPDLYPPTVAALDRFDVPAVIENPEARPDVVLCGVMFGLKVLRHRRIQLVRWSTPKPEHIRHEGYVRGCRHGVWNDGPYIAAYGKGGGKGTVPEIQAAMGIDWTDDRNELVEMLPPAYTQWIGERFMEYRNQ